MASQAAVGTNAPPLLDEEREQSKWLIYCSPSMCGSDGKSMQYIWGQRQMMLTLHCSLLLIFMQMFQLQRVCLSHSSLSRVLCIEIILRRVVKWRNDPRCQFPQYGADWLINWLIKIYSKRSCSDLDGSSLWRPCFFFLLQCWIEKLMGVSIHLICCRSLLTRSTTDFYLLPWTGADVVSWFWFIIILKNVEVCL